MTVTRRPWPRHPGYLIGDDGTIIGPRGRSLALFTDRRGYLAFTARLNGRQVQYRVHVAVCETFHGPRPPGREAAHGNGVQIDCRAVNVAWKTPAENAADKVRHGTDSRGEGNGNAMLTAAQVREIRASGEPSHIAAQRYPVSASTIRAVRNGRLWTHVC